MQWAVPEGRRSVDPLAQYIFTHLAWPFGAALFLTHRPALAATAFNALFLLVSLAVGTALHEFAHAAVASRLDMRILAIFLGRGAAVRTVRIGSVPVVLQSVPLTGITLVAPRSAPWLRTRLALVFAAGPLTNLALVVAAAQVAPLRLGQLVEEPSPVLVFAIAQALLFLFNALPVETKGAKAGSARGTDGWQVLDVFRRPEADLRAALAAHPFWIAVEKARQTGHASAEADFRAAYELAPDRDSFATGYGECLLMQHRYPEALPLLRRALALTLEPAIRATVQNNVAWCIAMVGDPALLEEAQRLSGAATTAFPERPEYLATAGAVSLLAGDPDAALEQLARAHPLHPEGSINACLTACLLAECHARRGEGERARERLEQARTYPGHPTLPAFQRALAACG